MTQIPLRGRLAAPPVASARLQRRSRGQFSALLPYLFLVPGMLLFALFIVWPMLYSLRISLYNWNIVHPEQSVFLGFQNYTDVINDSVFQRAVLNTVIYVVVTVPGQIVLGLLVALLLNQKFPGRAFFRTIYYLPVITSWVIVTMLFEFLFNGQAGLVNSLLMSAGLIQKPVLWLSDARLVMVPLTLLGIWKGVGWTAVIALAGLQSIPAHLYEAAAVDGANVRQRFWYITVPLLRPTLVFLLVVLTIGGMNVYISVLLMNRVGNLQNDAQVILTLMENRTFGDFNFGQGAAISYLLTVVVFVVSFIQIRLLQQEVDYS
jgi:multiple sugar transport system permease protein